jgi:hypothetical protein
VSIQQSTGGVPGGANAWQASPGGGFAFPGGMQQINPASNLAYRLNGTVVPEPGTMAVIGLGLAGLIARRRRKA